VSQIYANLLDNQLTYNLGALLIYFLFLSNSLFINIEGIPIFPNVLGFLITTSCIYFLSLAKNERSPNKIHLKSTIKRNLLACQPFILGTYVVWKWTKMGKRDNDDIYLFASGVLITIVFGFLSIIMFYVELIIIVNGGFVTRLLYLLLVPMLGYIGFSLSDVISSDITIKKQNLILNNVRKFSGLLLLTRARRFSLLFTLTFLFTLISILYPSWFYPIIIK